MRRWRGLLAGALVALAVVGLVVAAILAQGREESQSETNDGGAWLVNRDAAAVGHVNRVVRQVSVAVEGFSSDFDVSQADGVVVVHDRGQGQAVLIDTKKNKPVSGVTVPAGMSLFAVPGAVVAHAPETGEVRRIPREELSTYDDVSAADPVQGMAGEVLSVGRDGTLSTVGSDGVQVLAAGDDTPVELLTTGLDVRQSTIVGDTVVTLTADGSLWLGREGREPVEVAVPGDVARLEQPRETGDHVVAIGARGEVWEFDLDSGDETGRLDSIAGADVADALTHEGCTYVLAFEPEPAVYACGARSALNGVTRGARLLLVNGWVWVNDGNTGYVWFVTPTETNPDPLTDWSAALTPADDTSQTTVSDGAAGEEEPDENASETADVDRFDIEEENEPPEADPDVAVTRRGRAVVVRVLANDRDPNNDPLYVEELVGIEGGFDPETNARVTITADGAAVQVTPSDSDETISFEYVVSDGRGGTDQTTVEVSITDLNPETNQPPETMQDTVTVRAGESVSFNVLTNDSDPDGDTIVLVSIQDNGGRSSFSPDGRVNFTPDSSNGEGVLPLLYTIEDAYGLRAEGLVRVLVSPPEGNDPPEARNDVGRTTVGKPVVLNVLANDADPDGDPLVALNLQPIDRAGVIAQLTQEGTFLFRPEQPGTFRFVYSASDNAGIDDAQIRIEVEDAVENRPPIAVRDEVALAKGERRLIRVLDNDGDPDGDVVGIVGWFEADGLEIDEVPGVGFFVRATPDAESLTVFQYQISDGAAEPVIGQVFVSALDRDPVDYAPVAVSDRVEVRAGRTTEAFVLRNDYDPEGGTLRVEVPQEIPEALLRVSESQQSLLITVGETEVFDFSFNYDVIDEGGNRTAAVVRVRIVPDEQPNRSPVAVADVVRTPFEQRVVIPLLANDYDPDGDAIAVEGIAIPPERGRIEISEDGAIIYVPEAGFSGTDRFVYTVVDSYQPAPGSGIEDGPRRDQGEVFVGVMPELPENSPPSALDDVVFDPVLIGSPGVRVDVLDNDTDPDEDELFITDLTVLRPEDGSIEIINGGKLVSYAPPAEGESREVSFGYTVDDASGGSDTARVTVTLQAPPENLPPIVRDDPVGPHRAGEVVAVNPLDNDTDPEGGPLTVRSESDLLRFDDARGWVVEIPEVSADLPYRAVDSEGAVSELAYVRVSVTPNEPPVFDVSQSVTIPYETATDLDLHIYVSDPDEDPLALTVGPARRNGSVDVLGDPADNQLRVRFTPASGYEGSDAGIDIVADDRNGHVVTWTLPITVEPPGNREHTVRDGALDVTAGIQSVYRLSDLVDDEDEDGVYTFEVTSQPGTSVDVSAPDGASVVTITSTPDAGARTEAFEFRVSDDEYANSGTVTINVTVSDHPAPSVADHAVQVNQGVTAGPIDLLAGSADFSPQEAAGAGLQVTRVDSSPNGDVSFDAATNSLTFAPNPDFFGLATFDYFVRDARDDVNYESSGTVSVQVIGLPAQTAPPVVVDRGADYLIVNWQPPAGDAARGPVTGYELQASSVEGDQTVPVLTTSYRWDGLTPGVQYCFAVRAINDVGPGEYSVGAGGAECEIPNVVPNAPLPPSVLTGDTMLSMTWIEPDNAGSAVTGYEIRNIQTGETTGDLGLGLAYDWLALQNGQDYTFQVRALNDEGWSDWSAASAPVYPYGSPDAPPQPAAVRGDGQATVSWSAPAWDGGDPISDYEVQLDLDSSSTIVPASGGSNQHLWSALPRGQEVRFRVRAINSFVDPSDWSAWSDPVRICGAPSAVTGVTATSQDGQILIGWTPLSADPAETGGCTITEYWIDSPQQGRQIAGAGAASHPYTGLTNGTSYDFTVTAVNETITGGEQTANPSAQVSEIPAGPPLVSNVTAATATARGQITITWSTADPNGRPVTDYEYRVNSGPWMSMGTTGNSQVFSGLADGTQYTYQVRARNENGASVELGASRSATTWSRPGTPSVSASGGTRQVSANWTTPGNGGTALTGMQRRIQTGTAGCSGAGTAASGNSFTFGGLNDGTTYRVCIRYQNAVGWGAWGSRTATTTSPPAVTISQGGPRGSRSGGGFSCNNCYDVDVSLSNFASGVKTFQCQERIGSTWSTFFTYTSSANFTDVCFYGDVYNVRVLVNGVASNVVGGWNT